MALSPDGKFAFLIGGRKVLLAHLSFVDGIVRVIADGQHPEWTTSFEMNVIDLDMELRRTVSINDLCDFGEYFVQLYAIDCNTLVILDYNYSQHTLRQRLIKIYDEFAYSPFHRCYRYLTSQTSYIKSAIGDRYCAIISRERFEGDFVLLIFPKDPTNFSLTARMPNDLSEQLTQMNDELSVSLTLSITHYISPFFMRDDEDLCFLTINKITLDIDPKIIFCLNIRNKIWYTRQMWPNRNGGFPQDEYEQTPLVVDCSISGCCAQQVALVARYRTPLQNWRWRICDAVLWIQMRLVRLFFFCLDYRAELIGKIILSITSAISSWRDYLVLRPFTRYSTLESVRERKLGAK
ncbi:unnamed protein product [Toxocara canis]|uniref:CNH domain-containing protein n=1 Tax=Toxocara canis TaxID=6265 RepID=A0A183TZG9_TOXCA|nr:unnamed protein product [Toxocara canis]